MLPGTFYNIEFHFIDYNISEMGSHKPRDLFIILLNLQTIVSRTKLLTAEFSKPHRGLP